MANLEPAVKYQNKSILYVDDDTRNLTVFEYAFRGYYTVYIVETVQKAWEVLSTTNIGVLISDQRMPEQNGIDFLNEVSIKYPDVIRILLTAYADVNSVFEAINTGKVYAYITKPWQREDLQVKLDNALESHNLKAQNTDLLKFLSNTNEELRKTNEKLTAEIAENSILNHAIEQTTEVVILTDLQGEIVYVNSAFERKLAYEKAEVVGKGLEVIGGNKQSKGFYLALWSDLHKGISWTGRVDYKRKVGGYYQQEMTISAIRNEAGEIINFVSVGRDITKEAELQELLNQKQKLEAIGTFAGGIAHDFNNILVPIQGYALLLEDDIESDTQAWDDLQQIITATERAKNLVDQILTFSSKRKAVLKKIHILEIIKDSLKLIKPLIPKNVKITSEFTLDNDLVLADPVQIQQIIINLCNNAFHSMEDLGGELTLSVSNVEATLEIVNDYSNLVLASQYVKIAIKDTGTGMDRETISKIFNPFFTTKDKGKGTGLGLSNVHGILNSLNGDVSVESIVGEGSKFSVLLPVLDDVEQVGFEKVQLKKGSRQRIVIVDDDKSVLNYASKILRAMNYQVYSFVNSLEAFAFITKHTSSIFLIVTDFNMPVMSGKELIESLNKREIRIPVIVVTGFKAQLKKYNLENIVIEKPFTAFDITKAIQQVFQNKY